MNLQVKIIDRYEELPPEIEGIFFHSRELFRVMAATQGHSPIMAVAVRDDGSVAACLLACIRRRGSWLPPYLFTQGRIYGEGNYAPNIDRDTVFGQLLAAVTKRFKHPFCLYAEFSNMSTKMLGYRQFRELGYFPVSWQEVHNSLHTMHPYERLDAKMRTLIEKCQKAGVTTRRLSAKDDVKGFFKLIRSFYQDKPRHFIPSYRFFSELSTYDDVHFYLTEYHGKPIGCCVTVHTHENAYLWFLATKRKSHVNQHPDIMTVWHAILQAHAANCRHFYFMDAGLPFRKSNYRDFILRFGGKPVAKYRWFRFSFPVLNRLLAWLYRE